MEISCKLNLSYNQNFTALKIDPEMCKTTMDSVVNNIEVLNLTRKLHTIGQDLYVHEIPANLDMHSLESIPAKIKFVASIGKTHLKTVGYVLADKIKEFSANEMFARYLGMPFAEKEPRTLQDKVDDFNKLLGLLK